VWRRRDDALVPRVDRNGRGPRHARHVHPVELDLEPGRRGLAIDLELDLRESLLELPCPFDGDAFAIGLAARARDRRRLAK
jgi:hypothetical protein